MLKAKAVADVQTLRHLLDAVSLKIAALKEALTSGISTSTTADDDSELDDDLKLHDLEEEQSILHGHMQDCQAVVTQLEERRQHMGERIAADQFCCSWRRSTVVKTAFDAAADSSDLFFIPNGTTDEQLAEIDRRALMQAAAEASLKDPSAAYELSRRVKSAAAAAAYDEIVYDRCNEFELYDEDLELFDDAEQQSLRERQALARSAVDRIPTASYPDDYLPDSYLSSSSAGGGSAAASVGTAAAAAAAAAVV
eukprot:8193-Heterococcus_DN1.PRE.1